MSHMTALLAELDQLLSRELDTYRQLLQFEIEAKPLLTVSSLDPFLKILQAKEHLIEYAANLDCRRRALLTQLAETLPEMKPDISLQQLSERVSEPYAGRFCYYRTALHQVVLELRQHHDDHAVLWQESLMFVNHSLAFFDRVTPTHTTYQASGKSPSPQRGRLLSGKV